MVFCAGVLRLTIVMGLEGDSFYGHDGAGGTSGAQTDGGSGDNESNRLIGHYRELVPGLDDAIYQQVIGGYMRQLDGIKIPENVALLIENKLRKCVVDQRPKDKRRFFDNDGNPLNRSIPPEQANDRGLPGRVRSLFRRR